ncbi:MAG: haloacid dehalogenase type II, partial [Acidimicrobiia bacterium]|nr:haloacid dehalogenase type II [Acidimicrobiia bacterium]
MSSDRPPRDGVKALAFDVGGTVFDWQGATRSAVGALAIERGADAVDVNAFCLQWRADMFRRLAKVRAGELPWANADELHRAVLDPLAADHPELRLSDDDKAALTAVWHRMDAWPDFGPALPRLRSRYTVAVLTVLSLAIAVDCSKRNDLWWDAILSCELLGAYKPDPEAYQRGAEVLGFDPEHVMMVASHPGDLRAAMTVGFRTAFVLPRHDEPGGNDDGD